MKKKIISISIIMLLIGFLLLNPTEAVDASRSGLMLWFQSVLPVLLPFLILSRLLISLNGLNWLLKSLSPLTSLLLGLSPMGTYALLLGFLCGYPMGAKIIGDLIRENRISKEEGMYLLSFCNNVSPAFLLGFCMTEHLKSPSLIPVTLFLVYGTPLLYALFSPQKKVLQNTGITKKTTRATSIRMKKQTSGFQINFKIVDACIMDGLESILKLGCYIILFSIMARLAAQIPWPHAILSVIAIGTMEITNGIAAASSHSVPFFTRYLLVLSMVTFGGLSGVAQANSMLSECDIPIGKYIKAKLITVVLVITLAIFFLLILPGAIHLH